MSEKKVDTNGTQTRPSTQEMDQGPSFRVVDRRPFADLDSIPAAAVVEEKPRFPTFVEELMARLSEMERRFEEKKKQMEEEIAKMRNRMEADYERKVQLERRNSLLPLLEVLDNLERALECAAKTGSKDIFFQGVEMTASLFRARLLAHGVESIPVVDQPFDPNLAQAVGIVPVKDASKEGVVVEEVQRGYRIGDQLMRPAQVRVGKLESLAAGSP